ncbi:hypothetical protein BC834DRAFT_684183 [Gloeopeniophorella convolvens]|nr:hypothetical protein BC834DRAFT_684183 [Gloeopeniophorella convolvens]
MSGQRSSLTTTQVQGARFVNDFIDHPDYRLVAVFFLGSVFLSSLRYIWFSSFVRELAWSCKGIARRIQGNPEEIHVTAASAHEKAGMRHYSVHVADLYRHEQQDTLFLLLCMGFLLSSLSAFLSLLTFDAGSGNAACGFVIAASALASQASRIFGLLMLSLDLKCRKVHLGELFVLWAGLAVLIVLGSVTAGVGSGQIISVPAPSGIAVCFRKRFLPTSLIGSIVYFVLEIYMAIRFLSLVESPRFKFGMLQDTRIMQAGSLFLFDLLVVVPNATATSVVAEFILFSIGALVVMAAFSASLSRQSPVPTKLEDPALISRAPSRRVVVQDPAVQRANDAEEVYVIDNHPFSVNSLANQDLERFTPPSSGRRTIRSTSASSHVDSVQDAVISTASRHPISNSTPEVLVRDASPPAEKVEAEDRPRKGKEKILSYSSPIWKTFGKQQQSNGLSMPRPVISIEPEKSPVSYGLPSPEWEGKLLSPSSTILGSDIIRSSPSSKGKDRMKSRRSNPAPLLSPSSSMASPSPGRTKYQSWASRFSAQLPLVEEQMSQEDSKQPSSATTEGARPLSVKSSRSTKSRLGSRSSKSVRSTKSRKSSTRSIKASGVDGLEGGAEVLFEVKVPRAPAKFLVGLPASPRHSRAGLIRGPRPAPSASPALRSKLRSN